MPKTVVFSVALLLSAVRPAVGACPKPTADTLSGSELDAPLTLSLKDSDLVAVFTAVADATGLRFDLGGLKSAERLVNLEVSNMSTRDVLRLIEWNVNLKYQQQSGTIEVTNAEQYAE